MSKSSRVILLTCMGTVLEWFEYTYYAYSAYHLSRLFFPPENQHALFFAYAFMAIGYLIRPLGATYFGYIGDRVGRKTALMLSMLLLGIATAAMGCLPTYATGGLWGAIGLGLCRTVQGFAVSAEGPGAIIYLLEQSPSDRHYRIHGYVVSSIVAGSVLGGFLAVLVSWPGMPEWAWRAPFFLGGIACWISWRFRSKLLQETLHLNTHEHRSPLGVMWRRYRHAFWVGIVCGAFAGGMVYLNNVYIVSHLIQYGHWDKHQATLLAMTGELLTVFAIIILARRHDKYPTQAKRYLTASLVLSPFLTFWLFYANTGQSLWLGPLSILVAFPIINGVMSSVIYKTVFDGFPEPPVRYTGMGVGWALGACVSGFSPMFAEWYSHLTAPWLGPTLWMTCTVCLAIWVLSHHRQLR